MSQYKDVRNHQNIDFTNLNTHPYNIMTILLLAGLTMIFVGLSGAYLYTRFSTHEPPIKMPILFLLNTVVLMASSWVLRKAKTFYLNDDTESYQRSLLTTLMLTVLFIFLQFMAWKQLWLANPNISTGNMRAYIYAISIIHFLHILGGLPFFILFTYNAYIRLREPVSVLVYFSDPLKRLKLKLLTMYWRFLDILWLYLVLFFWANYFIQI
jgi:cytochrome c oxidase subunit III